MDQHSAKMPSPLLSIVPILALVALLFVTIRIFGSDALNGASQVVLLTTTAITSLLAMVFCKVSWKAIEAAICDNILGVATALLILLLIGALSGSWMISGVVPTLIYYGMQIIHPHFFLASCCLICAIVSVMTGSSWTTIATIGIALMGIGQAQGFATGWVAGAIISGAYFGDKISPLSDTTVLASSVTGTPLFTHIRYMLITTTPTMLITLAIFTVAVFFRQIRNRVCSLFRSNAMMPTIARKYPIISINPSVLLKTSMSFFEMLDLLVRANILIKRTC